MGAGGQAADLGAWWALAFDEAAAASASQAIGHHRAQREDEHGQTVRSYEVMVAPEEGLDQALDRVAPRLAYHLECLGFSPRGTPLVFVSAFCGDRLYFIESTDTLSLHQQRLAARPLPMLPGR